MRLVALARLAFPVLVGLWLAGGPASAAAGDRPVPPVAMELQRLSEHCWVAQGAAGAATDNAGFISNAGVVVTPEGVVVFDALGTPALARMLVERIRVITDQPIRKVVVSHYHADHIYGLQVFQDLGAEIVSAAGVEEYFTSGQADTRLQERRATLAPWIDATTRVVAPDRKVQGQERFRLGGVDFTLTNLGAAHSDADLTMFVEPDGVLYSGDIIFEGRVPFVGDANTKNLLAVLDELGRVRVTALVPGHGPAARDPASAIALSRRYVAYVREKMGAAVADMVPFEEAYAATDWSAFSALPAFESANRRNAYAVYLSLEAESLGGP